MTARLIVMRGTLCCCVALCIAAFILANPATPAFSQTPDDPCVSFRDGAPDLPDSEDLYRQCQGLFTDNQSSDDPLPVIIIGGTIAALLFVVVPVMVFVVTPIGAYLDHRRDRRENPWKYLPQSSPNALRSLPRITYPDNWDDLRRQVYRRDGLRCTNCGASDVVLHAHHVVPLSRGGTNNLSNLTTLCDPCHTLIHPHMQ